MITKRYDRVGDCDSITKVRDIVLLSHMARLEITKRVLRGMIGDYDDNCCYGWPFAFNLWGNAGGASFIAVMCADGSHKHISSRKATKGGYGSLFPAESDCGVVAEMVAG